MNNLEEKMDELFFDGIEAYHLGQYYDAHELWEELWSDFYFSDKRFIQGLIQMSISFYHLRNGNIMGAKGLMAKCLEKFDDYSGHHRNIDVNSLKNQLRIIQKKYDEIQNTNDFNWSLIPELI